MAAARDKMVAVLVLMATLQQSQQTQRPVDARHGLNMKECYKFDMFPNGKAHCDERACHLECDAGYSFDDSLEGNTDRFPIVILTCDPSTHHLTFGGRRWSPARTPCSAVCQNTCKNGGRCVAPNTCSCEEPYTGRDCSLLRSEGTERAPAGLLQRSFAPYKNYHAAKVPGPNQRRVDCVPGSKMADGSTTVTLSYRDDSWFYPDGSLLMGAHQLDCHPSQARPGPTRYHRRVGPQTVYVPPPGSSAPNALTQGTCSPPCRDGKVCDSSSNTCRCPRGKWGLACQLDYICNYPRFERDLNASRGGSLLSIRFECHSGHRTRVGASHVTVHCVRGVWKTEEGKTLTEDDVACLKE